MAESDVLYEVSGSVAIITLNRPQKLNAWNAALDAGVLEGMRRAEASPEVRSIVLTGAGRGFCAGADFQLLSSIMSGDAAGFGGIDELKAKLFPDRPSDGVSRDYQRTYTYFPSIKKPIIAAINGAAAGIGFVLTLYCDVRWASSEARFSTSFAGRGLIAEHGVAWMLPRLIGMPAAIDLLFSARLVDAAEALRLGLVSQVLPAEGFLASAVAYAEQLATNSSPRSIAVIKRQLYSAWTQTLSEAIDVANEEMIASFLCADFQEGVAHFLEKRPPRFTGQ